MNKFGLLYGTLSFFDGQHELAKMENGYNQSFIDRDISIAAAIYSQATCELIAAATEIG